MLYRLETAKRRRFSVFPLKKFSGLACNSGLLGLRLSSMPKGRPIDLVPQLREYLRHPPAQAGGRLPSVHHLAREWDVNRYALNRAVVRLIGEGCIERRGRRLFVPVAHPASGTVNEDPPVVLHIVAPLDYLTAEVQRLLEYYRCVPVFDLWSQVSESWPLFAKTRDKPCDGALLILDDSLTLPVNAAELINSLLERRIPVVCNNLPGNGSMVISDSTLRFLEAASHLAGLGHRRVLMPMSSRVRADVLPRYQHMASTFERLGLESVLEVLHPEATSKQFQEMLARHTSGKRPPSAVFCRDPAVAPPICAAAKKLGIAIPRALSILAASHLPSLEVCDPPVSFWSLGLPGSLERLALDLLLSQIRFLRHFGRMPLREIIEFKPVFTDLGSVGPCAGAVPGLGERVSRPVLDSQSAQWPVDPTMRRRQVTESNCRPYAFSPKVRNQDWFPLNLVNMFNRQLGHQNGWVSDQPLLHVPRGLQKIHGVPFRIAGGVHSHKPDCLVMRSAHAHVGMKKQLPETVRIPVAKRVQRIFFLHGCAWAQESREFACYEFHYADGEVQRARVVSCGLNPEKPGKTSKLLGNIQDYWPYPHRPEPVSRSWRRFLVTADGDPFVYERHLYTLHWANPHPDREVASIIVRSDPQACATLGLLAITAVLGGGEGDHLIAS